MPQALDHFVLVPCFPQAISLPTALDVRFDFYLPLPQVAALVEEFLQLEVLQVQILPVGALLPAGRLLQVGVLLVAGVLLQLARLIRSVN